MKLCQGIYFAGFRQNNSPFTLNGCGFKNKLSKKFIFRQLVTKILNFFRQNNRLFKQKNKKREIINFTVFHQNGGIFMQMIVHLKQISLKKVRNSTINLEFCRFWPKE